MTSAPDTPTLIYLVAGEASGDILGARLMAGLKDLAGGDAFRFIGVGGPEMAEQGLESLFPMTDLSVMGLTEVLPRLPLLLRRIRQTAEDIGKRRPAMVITIDAPDFCFRVLKRLRKVGTTVPLVHFVAPTVWAWRPGRAKKCAALLDHLLCLLPFEPPYFEREGLAATFVGHPVIEGGARSGDAARFREENGFTPEDKILLVLPGSRRGEATRLLPVFTETQAALALRFPNLKTVLPCAPAVRDLVEQTTADWPGDIRLLQGSTAKFDAFAGADAALAASGTVGLELALAGCPHVIAYRVNGLTAAIARRLIRVRFAHLVNIIADKEVIPEFLQENCKPENLIPAMTRLLEQGRDSAQSAETAPALGALQSGTDSPGLSAARTVLNLIAL